MIKYFKLRERSCSFHAKARAAASLKLRKNYTARYTNKPIAAHIDPCR